MEDRKERKVWLEYLIKFVLSCVAVFPVYAFLYLTFPASLFAFYIITAVVVMVFAPWEELKSKFFSD
ncbi:MAG TPA: hypothetical protein ENG14_03040 [Thermodesulforhabdus norvegica]|uniref:Uncharacterized protein n=1 Tax=Thermodesulforhabdus norvegica TaxID=39841 RepID=A0A7C1B0E2_9BACT|nr:hypothetical protein [Deltaproteobacteria bacterium]MBW2067868.1 hypothetical protein [Deltaproteobacteria bacterium]HDL89860.1 hypothetical protein [Thermodesulforhabdus norvegica]